MTARAANRRAAGEPPGHAPRPRVEPQRRASRPRARHALRPTRCQGSLPERMSGWTVLTGGQERKRQGRAARAAAGPGTSGRVIRGRDGGTMSDRRPVSALTGTSRMACPALPSNDVVRRAVQRLRHVCMSRLEGLESAGKGVCRGQGWLTITRNRSTPRTGDPAGWAWSAKDRIRTMRCRSDRGHHGCRRLAITTSGATVAQVPQTFLSALRRAIVSSCIAATDAIFKAPRPPRLLKNRSTRSSRAVARWHAPRPVHGRVEPAGRGAGKDPSEGGIGKDAAQDLSRMIAALDRRAASSPGSVRRDRSSATVPATSAGTSASTMSGSSAAQSAAVARKVVMIRRRNRLDEVGDFEHETKVYRLRAVQATRRPMLTDPGHRRPRTEWTNPRDADGGRSACWPRRVVIWCAGDVESGRQQVQACDWHTLCSACPCSPGSTGRLD